MSVPAQRDEPSLSSVILANIAQVQASVDRLVTRLDGLDRKFMPVPQIQDRFADAARDRADLRAQLGQAKTGHDADIDHLADKLAEAQRQHRADRRYAVTTSIAGLASVVALLALILAHVH